MSARPPIRCPHCGEDRQVESTDRPAVWFCNVCGREFVAPKG